MTISVSYQTRSNTKMLFFFLFFDSDRIICHLLLLLLSLFKLIFYLSDIILLARVHVCFNGIYIYCLSQLRVLVKEIKVIDTILLFLFNCVILLLYLLFFIFHLTFGLIRSHTKTHFARTLSLSFFLSILLNVLYGTMRTIN